MLALQGINLFFSTPRHRNIEPMGGLQKGCEIHRWQLRVAQPFDGAYNPQKTVIRIEYSSP